MRISDWSSDVCSSDLNDHQQRGGEADPAAHGDDIRGPAEQRADRRGGEQTDGEAPSAGDGVGQIGRASCRERVCTYVLISVVAVPLKKKTRTHVHTRQSHNTLSDSDAKSLWTT